MVAAPSNRWSSCQRALQAWVSDKSRLTFVAAVAAVMHTTRRSMFAHLVDLVKLQNSASTLGQNATV